MKKKPNWIVVSTAVVVFAAFRIFGDDIADFFRGPLSDEKVVQLLHEAGIGETYDSIEKYFPEDAKEWREEFKRLEMERRTGTYDRLDAIKTGAEIRQRNAAYIQSAADPYLIGVIDFQIKLHKVFEDQPNTCARLLMQGPAGLTALEVDDLKPVLDGAVVVFEAMHAGKTEPVQRSESTVEHWAEIQKEFVSNGHPAEDMDLVFTPDIQDPNLCRAFLSFFETVRDADFEGAENIRAEIATAVAES